MTTKETSKDGYRLSPARITWRGDIPYADDYGDVYYSEHYSPDGIDEVRRVFLEPSHILERKDQPLLRVGELGFGSGLNFLVTADWVLKETNARLHFVSFEAHPLAPTDWQRVNEPRKPKLSLAGALTDANLPLMSGWHTRIFEGGRIRLSVYHGSASEGITALLPWQADAWYLDGFAPDRNTDLWQDTLLHMIGTCTKTGGTVATFTATGHVRRNLLAAGFEMRKVDQRPHKRESLAGVKTSGQSTAATLSNVQVFGAGIAGASIARQLAEEDIEVTVFDPGGIAPKTSSMPYTILHPRLLGDGSANAAYRAHAFHFASHYLQAHEGYDPTPVLHVEPDDTKQKKFDRIGHFYGADDPTESWLQILTPEDASERAQRPIENSSFLFARTAVIDLAKICRSLLNHKRIEFVQRQGDIDHNTPTIVCTGAEARHIDELEWLEVNPVDGRLHELEFAELSTTLPIVGNGYLIPTNEGAVIGSTYEYKAWADDEALEQNLKLNRTYLPEVFKVKDTYRGSRAISSDRNPIVGKVAENLWVSTGHGSMGTSSGPYAAAILTAEIAQSAPVACDSQLELVHPKRFLERQARRGRLRRDR